LSIVPGTDSGVVSFPVGHRHVRGLLNLQDNVIEGRSTLLALTSTLSKLKGSSNTCVLFCSIGNRLFLRTLSDPEAHLVEEVAVAPLVDEGSLSGRDAQWLVELDVSLPVDLAGLLSLFDVESQVGYDRGKFARNMGERFLDVVEVQGEDVVAKLGIHGRNCCSI